MQKKIVVLTLIYYWVEATPLNADSVDFTDISNLKYDSKDLEDYLNYLEDEQSNNNAKKKSSNKGSKVNYNIEDLKKFFKSLGLKDDGSYDDSETYSLTEGAAAKAVGITGKENRTYKKGSKTRGFHRVHHKDEYKKDKEFYEDDEVSGAIDKVGAKDFGYDVAKGNGFDKGRFHRVRKTGLFGKQGLSDKGKAEKDFSAYEKKFDNYFDSDK
ncbi:unnamed protein product [Pieris macdunnoughi]|uniref:Uncharacterized protein n=1 Tax=Pieris macdunnoughi TaxID=345717 RepID=A0A821W5V5_9NEOP|nr:unnamed protein product [Pieris macdunnoughi]